MLIADAQVHIWAANSPERPWPARHQPHRPEPITKDDMLREMDGAGVQRAVLVPPSWEGERNDVCLAAAKAHPDRFAVMGRFDPVAPDARCVLQNLVKQPGMLGLRFTFHRPLLQPLLTEGLVNWVWPEAEQAGMPVAMLLPHALMHLIDDIAARHPGLRMIMDHMGVTKDKDDVAFANLDGLLALARRPNVAVKVSGIPMFMTDGYPYRAAHPYLQRIYEAFGPQRMFWGTDISRLPCTYKQGVTMFTEEMPWLTPSDLEWIMGRALCQWIGWKM